MGAVGVLVKAGGGESGTNAIKSGVGIKDSDRRIYEKSRYQQKGGGRKINQYSVSWEIIQRTKRVRKEEEIKKTAETKVSWEGNLPNVVGGEPRDL